MRLGFVQSKSPASIKAGLEQLEKWIQTLKGRGAQVICTQELFLTPYFCHVEDHQYFDLALSQDSETWSHLASLAKKYEIVLVASLFEQRTRGLFHNTLVVFDADGSQIGMYRKMHIPDDPGFYEKFYFTPGDLGYQVVKTQFGNLGLLVCWDQWFPEAARLTTLKGADVLLFPTAIGWDSQDSPEEQRKQQAAWKQVQVGHAIANGVFVVAMNRIGEEAGTKFWGHSFIADPFGETLHQCDDQSETEVVCELDLKKIDHYRKIWPFLRDRRTDSYGSIHKKFDD